MLTNREILETIQMIGSQHFDVRTITLGISLFDCISEDADVCAEKVYNKIVCNAKNLNKVAEELSEELGIPIVNKRVSVTPISLIGSASGGFLQIGRAMERAAQEIGIDFIGGYSALLHKGITDREKEFLQTIPTLLATTQKVCSSVNVASTRSGINMDAILSCGKAIKEMSFLSKEQDSLACAKFVVFANAVEDNPFMAGAFLGVGEGDKVVNVGVSGPGTVKSALEKCNGNLTDVAETVKKTAFKITRVGELVAREAAKRLNANFGIVDLSLAPTPVMGDSVAHILEEMGLSSVGACGTTAALALLNDAVKKGGVMASSHVGGLSGAFIPVSEDIGMITACEKGILTIEKLEAMTAVCSVGLDMIAVAGDTTESAICGLIADEMAIGVVNNKTTAVRVIPVWGKKVGDVANFGGLLGRAPIIKLNTADCTKFVNRGGRIPAPLHSLKN